VFTFLNTNTLGPSALPQSGEQKVARCETSESEREYFPPQSGEQKVARRETSGSATHIGLRIEDAHRFSARLQRAESCFPMSQRFHLWLPSLRGYAALILFPH
jgi:hypothetical protein